MGTIEGCMDAEVLKHGHPSLLCQDLSLLDLNPVEAVVVGRPLVLFGAVAQVVWAIIEDCNQISSLESPTDMVT